MSVGSVGSNLIDDPIRNGNANHRTVAGRSGQVQSLIVAINELQTHAGIGNAQTRLERCRKSGAVVLNL
jgi:hypothetical protein